jgi:hypothetical protein
LLEMKTDSDPAKWCLSNLIRIRLFLHLVEMNIDPDQQKDNYLTLPGFFYLYIAWNGHRSGSCKTDADPFGFRFGSTAQVLNSWKTSRDSACCAKVMGRGDGDGSGSAVQLSDRLGLDSRLAGLSPPLFVFDCHSPGLDKH